MLEALHRADPAGILAEMVRLPSYENEARLVEWLTKRWRDRGITFEVVDVAPGRQNVTATLGSGEPSLLFNSHLDTVPPGDRATWSRDPFGAEVVDGRLYGRGAVDAKGCLAGMIAAFETLAEVGLPKGRLVLTAVAWEEDGGWGSKAEVDRGVRAAAAIVGEPTELGPRVGHRGAVRLQVECLGRIAHSAVPEQGVNAVTGAGHVLVALDELNGRLAARVDPVLGQRPHLTVTTARGGEALNVVPGRCVLGVDRRFLPSEDVDAVVAEIAAAAATAAARTPGLVARVNPLRVKQSAVVDPAEPIVTLVQRTAAEVCGPDRPGGAFFAGCDMPYFSRDAGIPTVIFGPGAEDQCHKVDESLALADLELATRVYFLTAHRWLTG